MKDKLTKIDERMQTVSCYHLAQRAIEAYSLISPNIPKPLLVVNQNIHGTLDKIAININWAANTRDIQEKLVLVSESIIQTFALYPSFEHLFKSKAITIGAANTVLDIIKELYSQLHKWNKTLKSQLIKEKEDSINNQETSNK